MSYFVSTCESAEIHEDEHMANFEDSLINVAYEEINRPSTCHYFHEVLSIIDEYVRARQNILRLKRK